MDMGNICKNEVVLYLCFWWSDVVGQFFSYIIVSLIYSTIVYIGIFFSFILFIDFPNFPFFFRTTVLFSTLGLL